MAQFLELPDEVKIYLPLKCTLKPNDAVEVVWHDTRNLMRWYQGRFVGQREGVLSTNMDYPKTDGQQYNQPITVITVEHNGQHTDLPADARVRKSTGVADGTLLTFWDKDAPFF